MVKETHDRSFMVSFVAKPPDPFSLVRVLWTQPQTQNIDP